MRTLLALAAAAMLAGCFGATPYEPAAPRYGYRETEVAQDRYRVSFNGNTRTSRETVEAYLLFRAAELTRAKGGDYFRVVARDTEATTEYFGAGPTDADLFYNRTYRHGDKVISEVRSASEPGYGGSGATLPAATRHRAYAEIVIHTGKVPADDPAAYNATAVLRRIGPTVKRPDAD